MAALQILVLSVQVRVLVGQQKEIPHCRGVGFFFLPVEEGRVGAAVVSCDCLVWAMNEGAGEGYHRRAERIRRKE